MNLRDTEVRGRFFSAVERSYRKLEPFRQLVKGLVEEFAGSGYGDSSAKREILVNLMHQAVDAYTMALVANRPRVMITAKSHKDWYFAKKFEVAINNLLKEIGLERTLRKAVLDAFFLAGVVRVHLADSIEVMMEDGTYMDPGSPFVSNVSMEDFVFDMSAAEYHKVKFAGNLYRVPFEYLRDPMFNQEVVKHLTPTSKGPVDGERLESITRGQETDEDEVEPSIYLADFWDPDAGVIWTFAVSEASHFKLHHEPLAEIPWVGSQHGPYVVLGFGDVPGNVVPLSHASQLSGMSRLVNNIMRKQGRRARSQKIVHTYTPAGSDTAKKVQRSSDDQWVEAQDPREIGEVKIGGVDPSAQAFVLDLVSTFDRMAGNLTAILGLGAQSETVGQEQIIHQASSRRIAKMQYDVADFTRIIIRDLGQLLWDDAAKVIPGDMTLDGLDEFPLDATWTPEDRVGRFIDYELEIDVYSMPYKSPNERLTTINHLLTQLYVPLSQMMESQGGSIDFHRLNEILSDLANEPRLKEIIVFEGRQPGDEEESGMPAHTQRDYVRKSVPTQGSPEGRNQVQKQGWLAAAGDRQSGANAPSISQV